MRFCPLLLLCIPASVAEDAPPQKSEAAKEEPKPAAEAVVGEVVTVGEALIVGEREFCTGKQVTYGECQWAECPGCHPTNCEWGGWIPWSACLCDGLQESSRSITKHNNECGAPCDGPSIKTRNCDIECLKAPKNCALKEWGDWVGCDAGNAYQKERTRAYEAPENGGEGCNTTTREVQTCPNPPAPEDKDCEWGDWGVWSACTCTCDGGQRTRDRSVVTAPRGMGKRCDPNSKTEVAPCNTKKCSELATCVDGEWDEWGAWEPCSAKCGGGIQWRSRGIKTQANECGMRAMGRNKEIVSCNIHSCQETTDCKFNEWGPWSDCSCTCEGIKHRARRIAQYGAEGGEYCEGGTKEVEACNNYTSNPKCYNKPPEDCKLGAWEEGNCTEKCGGGQVESTRKIVKPNAFGGNACSGSLSKTEPCNTQSCFTKPPVDCKWNSWTEWGVCDKCGGQRKRTRTIARMPKDSGAPCTFENAEETMKCPRECHDTIYCVWSTWKEVGECSAKCGPGFIRRERNLITTTKNPVLAVGAATKLYSQSKINDQSRLQDLSISFMCGSLVTLLVLAVTIRVFRREHYDWNHI